MKKETKKEKSPELMWHRESRTLTLEGETALEYDLSWPEVTGAGLGGLWISRYYARLAKEWRQRWQREVYWKACLELADRRAKARPFTPWTGRLEGEVALWEEGLLSLRWAGEETRGKGRPSRVRWGDVWKIKEGAPCRIGELFYPEKGWRKRLWKAVWRQGDDRQAAGEWVPDPDWKRRARRWLTADGVYLTKDGVEVVFPQCAIAPAAEGTPVFRVPRAEEKQEMGADRRT